MRMRYDPSSGALYFRVVEGEIEETLELPSPGAYMDVAADGTVMGLEFLSVQEFVTFLTGFDGEVELPERLEPEEYDEVMRRAFQESYESASASDLARFFRETFRTRTDRERARDR